MALITSECVGSWQVWQSECVARIDPADGHVTGWVMMDGLTQHTRQASSPGVSRPPAPRVCVYVCRVCVCVCVCVCVGGVVFRVFACLPCVGPSSVLSAPFGDEIDVRGRSRSSRGQEQEQQEIRATCVMRSASGNLPPVR